MNTQILTSIIQAALCCCYCCCCCVSTCICPCVCVCVCVIIWWVAMWGNKSALSSWSGTKWLRKQAELWFYSLMFVNNIYNRGFREHRLWRTGRFRGSLKTNRETEKDRQQRQTETVKQSSPQTDLMTWNNLSWERSGLGNNTFNPPPPLLLYPAFNWSHSGDQTFLKCYFQQEEEDGFHFIISAQTQ